MNNILKFFIVLFCSLPLSAQELLTAEEAVRMALENNYSIEMARNDLEINQTGVSWGNAGILPSLGLTAASNNSIQSTRQTRADGNLIEVDNARNNNLNYGVVLDWTLFDGFRMFARYDQLKELEKLGEAELKQTILTRVSDVLITYYDLVQQQQQLQALDSTMVISEQRVELAQNRFTIGRSSKLEVLNAQVDLNTDRTTMLRQQELYSNTKIELNEILAREPEVDFVVQEDMEVQEDLLLPELQTLQSQLNTAYQTYLTNISLIELESENEAIAKENLDITMEKYRIGTIPTIEFRTAQLNYINAIVRHSNAKFQAKLSEINLKEFAGNLTL